MLPLAYLFVLGAVLQAAPSVAPAQQQSPPPTSPPAQSAPVPPPAPPKAAYQDAEYTGIITCRPNADSEYCANVADKFFIVTLKGKDYVLKPGLSDNQAYATAAAALTAPFAELPLVIGMERNVLAKVPLHTPVQMRFHGGGVDVRVLKPAKQGPPQYKTSHYWIAEPQPIEQPPKH